MPRTQALRIVSYNVRYFGHALKGLASTRGPEHRIARALAVPRPPPDVVCLQEIETISLRSRLARGRAHQGETQLASFMAALERAFAELGKPFPYDGFYFRAHANRIRKVQHHHPRPRHPGEHPAAARRIAQRRLAPPHHAPPRGALPRPQAGAHLRPHPRGRPVRAPAPRLQHPHLAAHPLRPRLLDPSGQDGLGPEPAPRGPDAGRLRGAPRRGRALRGLRRLQLGARARRCSGYLTEEAGFRSAQQDLGLLDPDDAKGWPTAGFMRMRMHLDHLFFGNGVRFLDLDGSAPLRRPARARSPGSPTTSRSSAGFAATRTGPDLWSTVAPCSFPNRPSGRSRWSAATGAACASRSRRPASRSAGGSRSATRPPGGGGEVQVGLLWSDDQAGLEELKRKLEEECG